MVSECSSDRRRHSGQPVPRPEAMFVLLAIVYSSLMAVSSSPSPGSERRQSPRIVTIKYGAVRGSIVTLPNRSLQPVEVFMGIPYASPPVGKLRFMPPVTSSHWTGVKSAMTPGPMCPQRPRESILNLTEVRGNLQRQQQPLEQFKYHSRSNQSEDCLYLNIFAPSTVAKKSSRMAVLVFVHGELNQWNSGSSYDGSVMASLGNVIVVTINYRLGVLGFFPALDGSSPGNFGLMDIVAALHWTQENIVEFGGDPLNVTIYGHGQGAAFVNVLMLAPMAKSLFRRAIMSSGSVLSPSALATDAVEYSKKLAAALGCPNEANRNSLMLYCLRQKSAQELLNVQLDVPSHLVSFGPTVDGMVIPNDPVLLMGGELPSFYGQYDLLFGVVSAEGFSPLAPYERKGIEPSRRDKLLRTLVRNLFTFHLQEIFLTLVNEYTDWNKSPSNPLHVWQSMGELLGDATVVAPTVKSGMLHSKVGATRSNTFFYNFNHVTNTSHSSPFSSSSSPSSSSSSSPSPRPGCPHGDDLQFVFGAPLVPGYQLGSFSAATNYSAADSQMAELVILYWTNFVKTGDPNGEVKPSESTSTTSNRLGREKLEYWPEYDHDDQQYLLITTKPRIKDHYHAHRLSYWLNLLPKLHVAGTSSSTEHHLLEDHENPMTYEGRPRPSSLQVTKNGQLAADPTAVPGLGTGPGVPGGGHSAATAAATSNGASKVDIKSKFAVPVGNATKNISAAAISLSAPSSSSVTMAPPFSSSSPSSSWTTSNSRSAFDSKVDGGKSAINTSVSMMMQQGSYSTALSVTIAVGCSLLILNVVVFAGIFYKRDKANYQRQRQQNKEQEDNNGVVDGSDQVKGLRENQSPVKLTTFTGNCSLYPGDPSLTPGLTLTQLSPSPLATPTPPPGHCHNNKAYSSSGHVAMINTSYYGQDHHHGHAHHHQHSLMGTLDKSSASKLVTVRGTLEFDDRDRQEMNI